MEADVVYWNTKTQDLNERALGEQNFNLCFVITYITNLTNSSYKVVTLPLTTTVFY